MPKFFIEIPHGEDKVDCLKAIRILQESGSHFLTNAEYGCIDNDHTARLFIEVDKKEDAVNIVPAGYRRDAKVVETRRFLPEKVKKSLEQLGE